MCVVIAKPMGVKLPTDKVLENCEWSNRDGIGVAWTDGKGVVRIKKDFASLKALKKWLPENVRAEDGLLVHFRLSTSGGVCNALRHPFPVVQEDSLLRGENVECDLAMAHNGVIYTMKEKAKVSDTYLFVREMVAKPEIKPYIRDSAAIQRLIGGFVGESNKLAFLYGDGHIVYFGEFEKAQGILYSNGQYKDWKVSSYRDDSDYYGAWDGTLDRDGQGNFGFRQGTVAQGSRTRALTEPCESCYKEYPVKGMVKDFVKYNGKELEAYFCKACFKAQRSPIRVYEKCELCHELMPEDDLQLIDSFIYQNGTSTLWACEDCAKSYEKPVGGEG